MTNEKLLEKMSQNMNMRNFSHYTYDFYIRKTKEMIKLKKVVYKVLTKEELKRLFDCVDNYKFKTIFMLAYGSGLRIEEIVNLRVEDIE